MSIGLYQWGPLSQPHYVVALSFGDAEKTIRKEYEHFGSLSAGDQLEYLGPYVQISDEVMNREVL